MLYFFVCTICCTTSVQMIWKISNKINCVPLELTLFVGSGTIVNGEQNNVTLLQSFIHIDINNIYSKYLDVIILVSYP